MRIMTKILVGAAGLAAIAAPAGAQYYGYANRYDSNPYARGTRYGSNYGMNANVAAQQCSAAVQSRLYNRTSLGTILGSLVGIPVNSYGRVVSITQQTPTRNGMRIRGFASSGRYAYNNYGPYGAGAYGALGYNSAAAADLSFRCDVDFNGYVRNVDINRRY